MVFTHQKEEQPSNLEPLVESCKSTLPRADDDTNGDDAVLLSTDKNATSLYDENQLRIQNESPNSKQGHVGGTSSSGGAASSAGDTSQSYEQPCHSFEGLAEFVTSMGGTKRISRILIANNGNAAIKAMRSLKQWAFAKFRNEREFEFVVLATVEDINANSEYIAEADYLVELPSGTNNHNFANIYFIVQTAEKYQCDGVWPGWGHASEDARLPLALSYNACSTWIGPSSNAMAMLGCKIGSTIIAQSVGVPCVPWSGAHVIVEMIHTDPCDGNIALEPSYNVTESHKAAASVKSAKDIIDMIEKKQLTCPIMIKAAAGGGGKGIRQVHHPSEVETAFRQVQNEVKGSLIFCMQLVTQCRHLEVQVLGDLYGNVMSLGTRDCTIQRRHQKIIEEGPAVVAPANVLKDMEDAAVRLCSAVCYQNTGTVEFLFDPKTTKFYFLEVNARLQVEHVVTEILTEINLPAAQVQVAMGIPLAKIDDVMEYSRRRELEAMGTSQRHCIAARITAEHVEENFRPTNGDVYELQFRSSRHSWGYFSIGSSGRIHQYADTQFGHIFASGCNREEARNNLILSLKSLIVRGEIRTNIEALQKILESSGFISNTTYTTWLEKSVTFSSPAPSRQPIRAATLEAVFYAAIYEASRAFKNNEAEFVTLVNQGQLPPALLTSHQIELVYKDATKFVLDCSPSGPNQISATMNDTTLTGTLRPICANADSDSADLGWHLVTFDNDDGRCQKVSFKEDPKQGTLRVSFDGATYTFNHEVDPTQIRAPVGGKLVRWLVPNEYSVTQGQPYAEIEIMKMYMQLTCHASGTITHALSEGAVFSTGDILGTLELPAGVSVVKAETFKGQFQPGKQSYATRDETPLALFRKAKARLNAILDGYFEPLNEFDNMLNTFESCLFCRDLVLEEIRETVSVFESQLPSELMVKFASTLQRIPLSSGDGCYMFDGLGSMGSPDSGECPADSSAAAHQPTLPNYDETVISGGSSSNLNSLKPSVLVPDNRWIVSSMNGLSLQNNTMVGDVAQGMSPIGSADFEHIIVEAVNQLRWSTAEELEIPVSGTEISEEVAKQKQNTRIQLEPLDRTLKKYEGGLVFAAIHEIRMLLEAYLNVEELFNDSEADYAGKALQLKRTELSVEQLLTFQRSHQMLRNKNKLILNIFELIRLRPELMDKLDMFYSDLMRIASLWRIEYASVSHEARQLLLTRKVLSFSQRLHRALETGWEILEFHNAASIASCPTSPVTFGGRIWPTFFQGSSTPIPTTAKIHQPPASSSAMVASVTNAASSLSAGFMSPSTSPILVAGALDHYRLPTDCLLGLLVHPNLKLKKLSLTIFIVRTFGGRPSKIHDLKIKGMGECWEPQFSVRSEAAPSVTETRRTRGQKLGQMSLHSHTESDQAAHQTSQWSPATEGVSHMLLNTDARNTRLRIDSLSRSFSKSDNPSGRISQEQVSLIAVWTHEAVLTLEFLASQCDPIDLETCLRHENPNSNNITEYCPISSVSTSAPVLQLESNSSAGSSTVSIIKPKGVGINSVNEESSSASVVIRGEPSRRSPSPPTIPKSQAHQGYSTSGSTSAAVSGPGVAKNRQLTVESTVAAVAASPVSASSSSTSKYVTVGSRLHHILNAFGGTSDDPNQNSLGRIQQSTLMVFTSAESFETTFGDALNELHTLDKAGCLPAPPPSSWDAKLLHIICLQLEDSHIKGDDGVPLGGSETVSSVNGVLGYPPELSQAWFIQILTRFGDRLRMMEFHLICVTVLAAVEDETTSKFKSQHNNPQQVASGDGNDHNKWQQGRRFYPEVSSPKYYYFRATCPIGSPRSDWFAHRRPSSTAADAIVHNPVGEESTPTSAGVNAFSKALSNSTRPLSPNAMKTSINAQQTCPEPICYVEESVLRQCEISNFQYLELKRLNNFYVRKPLTSNSEVHLYEAIPKTSALPPTNPAGQISASTALNSIVAPNQTRYFLRLILNYSGSMNSDELWFEQERVFVAGLNSLELVLRESGANMKSTSNHIILSVICMQSPHISSEKKYVRDNANSGGIRDPRTSCVGSPILTVGGGGSTGGSATVAAGAIPPGASQPSVFSQQTTSQHLQDQYTRISPSAAEAAARALFERYVRRIRKLSILIVEIRFKSKSYSIGGPREGIVPFRIVLDNPTNQSLRLRKFVEILNPSTGEQVFAALDSGDSIATLILKSSSSTFNYEPASTHTKPPNITNGRPASLSRVPSQNKRPQTASNHSQDENKFTIANLQSDLKSDDYDGRTLDVSHPYSSPLQIKRAQAASLSTLYIYDFLELLEVATRNLWKKCPKYLFGTFEDSDDPVDAFNSYQVSAQPSRSHSESVDGVSAGTSLVPDKVVEAVELALNWKGELEEVIREPGKNECAMVAWKVLLRTPEFPKGRRVYLIGNDVTYNMGTFGVQEDLLFQRASEMARLEGVPRIYIAVNSGARLGLASEIQNAFRVEWIDFFNPAKGFKYIYLTEKDYLRLAPFDSVVCEPIAHPSEGNIYRITDIIGSQLGLGVENLCGSGAIAGETSRAFRNTFTITYVTGRTVGIGAYLTRLGHRVIQKTQGAPILLTGHLALNRLIGREVYTSNEELGGVDIMFKNGVSHLIAQNDLEGCELILDWLSYVPEHREGPLPIMIDPSDPITRRVEYRPSSNTDDPRNMLNGCVDTSGKWLGGILDRGSFREVMSGWAKSVIVGRGRLGGIPVGVISVETRVSETLIPADPAMPQTSETTFMRAGQVWFPESAYKTAQAIEDFNQEEIPLLIFANWRGFSGGQRDMFFEVLKFGSMIVDALVAFKQPCFVYIPPKGELRGGAWVVVDPRINSEHMEMFADPNSRGSVLEPTGTVEIKFREKDLRSAAFRSDPVLKQITSEDQLLAAEGLAVDSAARLALKERREKRLAEVMPVFKQIAVHFADLHDTSIRMKKKHAINDIVNWEKSRQFFYWRLRRQLILFSLRNEAMKLNPNLSVAQSERLIYRWASESGHSVENSQQFVQWACHSIQDISRKLHGLRVQYVKEQVSAFCCEAPSAVYEALQLSEVTPISNSGGTGGVAVQSQNRTTSQQGNPLQNMSERQQNALDRITQPTRRNPG